MRQVTSAEELLALVEEVGFLPFFKHRIPGFSVEECCPPHLWFAADVDGPWEWKGPVARSGRCIYGKFFRGKAGFVSQEWIPDFLNYRRDGYDFDSRFEDELASLQDKAIFDAVSHAGKVLSKHLKKELNYSKEGNKGFDTAITRLQMQGYLCVADFVYMKDKTGKPYGWGVAEYTTPEWLFDYELTSSAYSKDPGASLDALLEHLRQLLPNVPDTELLRLIRS
ncbi:MAG: hypothetical protein IJY82_00400 [Oscillospiraceae bacterium]|nr:hypothetical protein [Oscillospiraceae bacterium]